MLTKETILKTIEAMSEDKFNNIDEVVEEIILLEKIERSLSSEKKGEFLSEEEADKEMSRW